MTAIKNIGIDAYRLRDYGVGTYLQNILKHIGSKLNKNHRYFAFCLSKDIDLLEKLNPEIIPVSKDGFQYSKFDLFKLSGQIRRMNISLFHIVHYFAPFLGKTKGVITVHDMLPLEFPEAIEGKYKRNAEKSIGKALENTQRIIAVSKSTKSDILKHFAHIDPEKIEVIYNGVNNKFFKPGSRSKEKFRERYQLNFPFILYAGNVRPHKNIERLIEAVAELKESPYTKYKLVIAGYDLSRNKNLRRLINRKNLNDRVRFLGFIEKVEYLYQLADLFICPSLYEGFGVSILEAMAVGTPVISSNKSVMPEIAGDCALLVDPYNVLEITEGIKKLILESKLRKELIRKGKSHAKKFRWEESVKMLVDVYDQVLE